MQGKNLGQKTFNNSSQKLLEQWAFEQWNKQNITNYNLKDCFIKITLYLDDMRSVKVDINQFICPGTYFADMKCRPRGTMFYLIHLNISKHILIHFNEL